MLQLTRVIGFIAVLLALARQASANLPTESIAFPCNPLTQQRSDPIRSPGVASGHVHAIVGGNAFRRNMSALNSAKIATASSCSPVLDNSNYWSPQLYHIREDGLFEMAPFMGASIYYQNRACNYTSTGSKWCTMNNVTALAPPAGLRMVAGDSTRRTYNASSFEDQAISFVCIGAKTPQSPQFPTKKCNFWRSQVFFPSCWDGIHLDSADHKSHMSYPEDAHNGGYNGGQCPSSHPIAIFSILVEFDFDTSVFDDANNYVLANGDTTGYGGHADFLNGWTNATTLQDAFKYCVSYPNKCPMVGKTLRAKSVELLTKPVYEEQIGLNGPIAKLPGNNPVYSPPAYVMQKSKNGKVKVKEGRRRRARGTGS